MNLSCKTILLTLLVCASQVFATGTDVDGNQITTNTFFGDVNGKTTTVGDLGSVISVGLMPQQDMTNYVSQAELASMDTSYYRTIGITNKNQSIQYVTTDDTVSTLAIEEPLDGLTKDWIVYINAGANLTLILPAGDYWCSEESVTNEVPANTPTALYFSQIADNLFTLARKELVPIRVDSTRSIESKKLQEKMKGSR